MSQTEGCFFFFEGAPGSTCEINPRNVHVLLSRIADITCQDWRLVYNLRTCNGTLKYIHQISVYYFKKRGKKIIKNHTTSGSVCHFFFLLTSFQDDKDLVHEFVVAEGLTCLIKVGAEADQNYQNYILRGACILLFPFFPPLQHFLTPQFTAAGRNEEVIHQRCHTLLSVNPSRTTCVYTHHVNWWFRRMTLSRFAHLRHT